jgi:hypothetical protein
MDVTEKENTLLMFQLYKQERICNVQNKFQYYSLGYECGGTLCP